MDNQKNMILALVLSLVVLVGWSMMFPAPEPTLELQVDQSSVAQQPANMDTAALQATPDNNPAQLVPVSEPVRIFNESMALDVQPETGDIVGAVLMQYQQSLDQDAAHVQVLGKTERGFSKISSGLLTQSASFSVDQDNKQSNVLILNGQLEDGRTWTKTLRLQDSGYAVSVRDVIHGKHPSRLYRQVVEKSPQNESENFYEYVGPIGFIEEKLQEIGYTDLDEVSPVRFSAEGGWTGIMSRYFIASIVGQSDHSYRYYFKNGGSETYQAGLIDDGVFDGENWVYESTLYIGPKSISEMQKLGSELERAVDFGWFAFISKPLHDLLLFLYQYIPNYGWCIILVVLFIKILFFWPTKKSYESMAVMRKLQPEMTKLRELYGDDKQKMSQEMMGLYKKHKANPLGGCLPIVIQIPVFFALYKVLLMSIEMRHAPFMGWIHDLSAQDPFFVLPVLMGASMFVQQQLNPQPPDPIQAKVMKFLPIIFTVMFLFFPAGLVLYWLVNNLLSITQQWFVLKQQKAV